MCPLYTFCDKSSQEMLELPPNSYYSPHNACLLHTNLLQRYARAYQHRSTRITKKIRVPVSPTKNGRDGWLGAEDGHNGGVVNGITAWMRKYIQSKRFLPREGYGEIRVSGERGDECLHMR